MFSKLSSPYATVPMRILLAEFLVAVLGAMMSLLMNKSYNIDLVELGVCSEISTQRMQVKVSRRMILYMTWFS